MAEDFDDWHINRTLCDVLKYIPKKGTFCDGGWDRRVLEYHLEQRKHLSPELFKEDIKPSSGEGE